MPPEAHGTPVEPVLSGLASRYRTEQHPSIKIAGVAPAARAWPGAVGDLQEIVDQACRRGHAMAATGAGTKLGIGNPPSRLDLLLDMSGMDSIIAYDAEDLVMTAQAGATIGSLRAKAGADSLVLPLEPRSGDRATLGGVISCADHGPRRRQYGGLRDLVLGLKVVLADGTSASFGGRTLKNVAGYDVGKLFIGSLGSIGIVTEATLRLLPRPMSEELLFIALPDLEVGQALVDRILASPLLPSALELVSPGGATLAGLDRGTPAAGGGYLLLVGLEGHANDVERQVRDISGLCVASGAENHRLSCLEAREVGWPVAGVWDALAGLRARALAGASSVGLRCTSPLAHVWKLAAAVEAHSLMHDINSAYTVTAGTGHLELYGTGEPPAVRAFAKRVRAEAERLEGAAWVLDGWPCLGGDFDAWGSPRTDSELMRAVKTKFDPKGLLNPGRFVGGL